MIGHIILLGSLLTLASTDTPDYCPYFPKNDSIHCSQMCEPFRLGEPIFATNLCYDIYIKETISFKTHVELLLRVNSDTRCFQNKVVEMAIQAIDGDGYPIGQWEAAVGEAGLDLFRPHCNVDKDEGRFTVGLNLDPADPQPLPEDLPTVTVHKCRETPSLRMRLDNISTTFGFSKKVPTYVRYSQNRTRGPFRRLGLLWHHDYNVTFKVTFLAEMFYFIKDGPLSTIESTLGHAFFEYIPPPALPTPTPTPVNCFNEGDGPIKRERGITIYNRRGSRPLQVAKEYLDELNGVFGTGMITTTTTGPMPIPPMVSRRPSIVSFVKTTRAPTPPPPVIKGKNTPPTFVGPPPAKVTPSPASKLSRESLFKQCQETKRCLASNIEGENGRQGSVPGKLREQDKCIESASCRVMLTYGSTPEGLEIDDNYVYIEMAGKTNSWVAMGLSKNDTKMLQLKTEVVGLWKFVVLGDDFVIECVHHRNNASVTVHTSWNVRRSQNPPSFQPINERLDSSYDKEKFAILSPRKFDSGIVGEYVFCKFSLKKILFYNDVRQNGTKTTFNLVTTLDFIQMTVGTTNDDASKNLNKHLAYEAWVTDFKVGLGARFSPTPKQQRMIHGHGQIMYFIFLFIFPNSLFISRYYKETFIKRRILGMKDWHFVHTFLQTFGLVAVFGGHFLLSFGNDGWASPKSTETQTTSHLWISLTTGTMNFFNAFLGCVDQERAFGSPCDFCHWLHAVLGHVTYIFALATLVGADKVQYSYLSCAARGLVIAWIVIYVVFNVFMSYHYCWIDWVSGTGGRAYAVGPLELIVQPESVEVAPGRQIRIYILIAFVVITGVFTIALVTLAGTADKDTACYKPEYFIDLNDQT